MLDALEQAKESLETTERIIQRDADKKPAVVGDYVWTANQCLQQAQAAALIAIAEQMKEHTNHLSDIRCHLADILAIFDNATSPIDGGVKVSS